jgi:hypothetical protein
MSYTLEHTSDVPNWRIATRVSNRRHTGISKIRTGERDVLILDSLYVEAWSRDELGGLL